MAFSLLNIALAILLVILCSSSISCLVAGAAIFALSHLLPQSSSSKTVTFDTDDTVYIIAPNEASSESDSQSPESSSNTQPDVSSSSGREERRSALATLEEEEEEDFFGPYAISVDDYIPTAAMSLPPIRGYDPGPNGEDAIEVVGEDEEPPPEELPEQIPDASPVPFYEQRTPLSVLLTNLTSSVLAAGTGGPDRLMETDPPTSSEVIFDESPFDHEVDGEEDATQVTNSLADLSAELHHDLRVETTRARQNFVQPSGNPFGELQRDLWRQGTAQITSDADETQRCHSAPASASGLDVELCAVQPESQYHRRTQSFDGRQGLIGEENFDATVPSEALFQIPVSRVDGHNDLTTVEDPILPLPNPTDRLRLPTSVPMSRSASAPLPIRSTAEENVPVSPTETIAQTRIAHDQGQGLSEPIRSRRVGQRVMPTHRPWASSGSALQPVLTQRATPFIHKRCFSESHSVYLKICHPDYVANLRSPLLIPTSAGGGDIATEQLERRASGDEGVQSRASMATSFSDGFLSPTREDLEGSVYSAVSADTFDRTLRMHGYTFGISRPYRRGGAPSRDHHHHHHHHSHRTSGPSNLNGAGRRADLNGANGHSDPNSSQPSRSISPLSVHSHISSNPFTSPSTSASSGGGGGGGPPGTGSDGSGDSSDGVPFLSRSHLLAERQRTVVPYRYQRWSIDFDVSDYERRQQQQRERRRQREESGIDEMDLEDDDEDEEDDEFEDFLFPASRERLRMNRRGRIDSPPLPIDHIMENAPIAAVGRGPYVSSRHEEEVESRARVNSLTSLAHEGSRSFVFPGPSAMSTLPDPDPSIQPSTSTSTSHMSPPQVILPEEEEEEESKEDHLVGKHSHDPSLLEASICSSGLIPNPTTITSTSSTNLSPHPHIQSGYEGYEASRPRGKDQTRSHSHSPRPIFHSTLLLPPRSRSIGDPTRSGHPDDDDDVGGEVDSRGGNETISKGKARQYDFPFGEEGLGWEEEHR